MTTFVEERLLDRVTYGSVFGHSYSTRIKTLKSGVERRNARWSAPLHRGAVLYRNLLPDHHNVVIATHHACQGALTGFRHKDWSDFTATGEVIGTSTGSAQDLQLIKTYTFGAISLARDITKPILGTVTVYGDGSPIGAAIDYSTGIASINVSAGQEITWDGEFDVPVRFETDDIEFSADSRSGGSLLLTADVGIVEIRI